MSGRNFHHKPAIREQTPILVGLTGPSGSGKTKSGLRLATGIVRVRGGSVVGLDTESNRMLHYAPAPGEKADPARGTYDFLHVPFSPPHSSEAYREALLYCAELAKGGCVMVDSMSHEHEGEGGYLEMHETEIDRMAGEKKDDWKRREALTWAGWIKPARNRRKLINALLQINCAFIFCFRAKEKIKPVKGGEPILLGWQAIAGEEFVYEMTSRLLLPPGAFGVPSFDKDAFAHNAAKLQEQHREMFVEGAKLDEETGEKLARWAGGKKSSPPATITDEQVATLKKKLEESTVGVTAFLSVAGASALNQILAADYDSAIRYLEKRPKK